MVVCMFDVFVCCVLLLCMICVLVVIAILLVCCVCFLLLVCSPLVCVWFVLLVVCFVPHILSMGLLLLL